jgi:glutamate synthase (NADPH/NADH) small chain
MGVMVGRDISLEELRAEYDAVFLCVGARQVRPPDIPGAGLQGVYQALPFLMQKTGGFQVDHPQIDVRGKRVAVLGAGSTAMDCLRTAIRCGAREAIGLSRRDAANIRCGDRDYTNAVEEGAQFSFLTQPIALLGNETGQVTDVRCRRTELEAPDASGRLDPRPIHGTEFNVPAEVVLVAYGFDPVPFPTNSDLAQLAVNESGRVLVNSLQMTSLPGVFAGGDLVRGPSLVVHAVRDARKAAAGIHTFLSEQVK